MHVHFSHIPFAFRSLHTKKASDLPHVYRPALGRTYDQNQLFARSEFVSCHNRLSKDRPTNRLSQRDTVAGLPCSTNRALASSNRLQRESCRVDIPCTQNNRCNELAPCTHMGAAQIQPPPRSGICPSVRLCLHVPSSNLSAQTTGYRVWRSVLAL